MRLARVPHAAFQGRIGHDGAAPAALGSDSIWCCVVMLGNGELAQVATSYGVLLCIVRSIVPNTSMAVVNDAAFPIILYHVIVMGLIVAFPALAMWLPAMMTR